MEPAGVTFKEPTQGTRTVLVKAVFLKILEVNTLEEQFTAEVFIQASWTEPALQQNKVYTSDVLEKLWNSQISIKNCISCARNKTWYEAKFSKFGSHGMVVQKSIIKGEFTERMDLNHFPFDKQDLSLHITSDASESNVVLKEDPGDMSRILVNNFTDVKEWYLYDCVETEEELNDKALLDRPTPWDTHTTGPGLNITCHIERKPTFYLLNIYFLMGLITSLCLPIFAVERTKPQNRLQLSFILLLTANSFKYSITNSIPKVPYTTYLDKYFIMDILIMYVSCIWHGFVTLISDEGLAEDIDQCVAVGFVVVYAVSQVVYFISVILMGYRSRVILVEKEKEYQQQTLMMFGESEVRPRQSTSKHRSFRKTRVDTGGN